MPISPNYASLALVGQVDGQTLGIETLAVDFEGVALTGAWDYKNTELEAIESVISHRSVIALDEFSRKVLLNFTNPEFPLYELFIEIREQNQEITEEFERHLTADKAKKQKLVTPDLCSVEVPNETDNVKIFEILLQGKSHPGLDLRFARIILAAWAVRDLILKWQHNETERVSRKYLDVSHRPFAILPEKFIY